MPSVVVLTSNQRGLPQHISVADDGGLERPSWAMCEAVRAVSIQRFGRMTSTATHEALSGINDQLLLWLAPEASRQP
ncbi:MAG TPA: type II toxin-antitoxin system PemK/MazF family toxin [Acidimicrobiales bacterium]|nr:type II toxin-antitoxin system PemK/MazF family toxin [Acidimicrobiales bacterium]